MNHIQNWLSMGPRWGPEGPQCALSEALAAVSNAKKSKRIRKKRAHAASVAHRTNLRFRVVLPVEEYRGHVGAERQELRSPCF